MELLGLKPVHMLYTNTARVNVLCRSASGVFTVSVVRALKDGHAVCLALWLGRSCYQSGGVGYCSRTWHGSAGLSAGQGESLRTLQSPGFPG